VAVIADGRELTYAELGARADRLARRLAAHGVGPDTVVGLCLDDGMAFIVAALAVLEAGGAYLPLDPDHPRERLAFMLGNAAASVVVTAPGVADRLPADLAATVLRVDRAAADVTGGDAAAAGGPGGTPPGAPPVRLHPDNAAYVIYTSGSTGSPKAVAVGHRTLARSTHARLRHYAGPVGTFYLLSPVIFDSSVAGIFWTLCSGGTLLLPPRGRRLVDEIARDISRYRVTHVVAVPSLLAQLADWHGAGQRDPLDSLRFIITAGEACPAGLAARLSVVAPRAALYNEYGPTEAGVWATAARLVPEDQGPVTEERGLGPPGGAGGSLPRANRAGPPPIGAPIPGAVCHVLDARLRPAPAGVPGELFLGGAGLARGYAARPALTAQRFVADPLAGDGSRLYRTGDLARWRPDGQLEFLGRSDNQIKLAGYRIEPGEVEAVLRGHPRIATAVVTAPDSGPAGPVLVAYVVPASPGQPVTAGELRAFCQARLPEYLIPAAFVPIPEVPLTATGKTDRAALTRRYGTGRERGGSCGPAPDGSAPSSPASDSPGSDSPGSDSPGSDSPGAGDAPRTGVEREVAEVWREVLGLDRVGVHDDFFALGGNSLQAVRISTQLQQLYDVELPLRRLFEATTVAALADALVEAVEAEVAALADAEVEAILAEPEAILAEPGPQH
jgi:amino acid adenylation domain-containing protein